MLSRSSRNVILRRLQIHPATLSPFYQHELSLTPAWKSNHIYHKVWHEVTYPLPNFNGDQIETMLVEGASGHQQYNHYCVGFTLVTRENMCAVSNFAALIWRRHTVLFLEEDNESFILHSQVHSCLWSSNAMNQGISRLDIDLVPK